jgi:chromate transporter
MREDPRSAARPGSPREVFIAFLKLGLTSFGGPIAHLGYFHRELVERRRWIDPEHYAQLVALCQSLPGPASSQLGFALGLMRAGWPGAIAAFVAFTTPSVLLLIAFAQLFPLLDHPVGRSAIHGLKLLAVAVVAQGLLVMARTLAPDVARRLIAAAAAAVIVLGSTPGIQLLVIVIGAVLGLLFCRGVPAPEGGSLGVGYSRRLGSVLLLAFGVLLIMALVPARDGSSLLTVAGAFYRAGALVFGGGHVVLPLLQEAVVEPGWVAESEFLAGYGAAQAVPGPMFSLAAFLGARLDGAQGGAIGAVVSMMSVMLPGLLLVAGALPWWSSLARHPHAAHALAGINAAVVGLLAAALYSPVWTSAVEKPLDFAIVLVGFVLLAATRTPLLAVLAWCVVAAVVGAALV